MPTITGMKGGGFYDRHSTMQRDAMEPFLPWLEEAAASLPAPEGESGAYTWLDLGSSEGANALYAMGRAIAALRQRQSTPLRLGLMDLPTNDFNQLFTNLFPGGQSALGDDVYPYAVGGSAFQRLAPARSLHLATTFNAISFLESRPATVPPKAVFPHPPRHPRAGVALTPEEQAPYREESARNLQAFYAARAEELVPGGKLLVQLFGRDDQAATCDGIQDIIGDTLLDLIGAGELPEDLYTRIIFPVYCRSLEEMLAPVADGSELADVFSIEQAESREVSVYFNDNFDGNSDLEAWSHAYADHFRAFTEAVIAAHLPAEDSRAATLDCFYQRSRELLVADPDRYRMRFVSNAVLLTRI
ncbi:MAG: cyclopropane-fatty-acyl-phospholipid synthase [Verrucomicrobiota bacterium]